MQLHIDGWKTNIRFSAAHFIPSHNKCSRLHGHDYAILVNVYGEPVDGILVDFVEVKHALRNIVAEMDHKLLVPEKDKYSQHNIVGDECTVNYNNKRIVTSVNDVYLCDVETTSSEELSEFIGRKLLRSLSLKKNIKKIEMCVEEGPGQGAYAELIVNE